MLGLHGRLIHGLLSVYHLACYRFWSEVYLVVPQMVPSYADGHTAVVKMQTRAGG